MATGENPARQRILERISSALKSRAPRHAPESAGEIFPEIPDPLGRFQLECSGNKTELRIVRDESGAAEALASLAGEFLPGEIFVEDAPVLRKLISTRITKNQIRWSSSGGPGEGVRASITRAEFLVAQTGSVVVSSSCGGRGAFAFAPLHIVVAGVSELVVDLAAALAQLRTRGIPEQSSSFTLITGPSRTADIEKQLVMGAHGPIRLVVILIAEGR
ncbi:MAG TPA: LUD domain-containing protein [Verrucomicrobiae bacterium]|nr:LUD domain-containing protein [Verrucomicrobiae bacterium]